MLLPASTIFVATDVMFMLLFVVTDVMFVAIICCYLLQPIFVAIVAICSVMFVVVTNVMFVL